MYLLQSSTVSLYVLLAIPYTCMQHPIGYKNRYIIDAIKIVHSIIIGYIRLTMVTYMKQLAFRSIFLSSYKSL